MHVQLPAQGRRDGLAVQGHGRTTESPDDVIGSRQREHPAAADPGGDLRRRMAQRDNGGVGGRCSLEHQRLHDLKAGHVLGRVAAVRARGVLARSHAVPAVPGAQRPWCDAEPLGDGGDRQADSGGGRHLMRMGGRFRTHNSGTQALEQLVNRL